MTWFFCKSRNGSPAREVLLFRSHNQFGERRGAGSESFGVDTRHRQAMAATRRCHRLLLQELVTPVTHAPLAARLLRSRWISSKEDTGATGLNPSIILHMTGRTKPIFQL